ncbi:EAL domain-containing protein [Sulfurimonas sp.]|uniref:EAL domain-containing protein n=1 Tax=Sulfurimonas sp. TaxID=2022749 RepID=UPI00262700BA|nr:EAL domain-containing protein [Sulfurimonas sp.]MDD3451215.1 EAL domain-containing protein [Sulfurimonas sp.]
MKYKIKFTIGIKFALSILLFLLAVTFVFAYSYFSAKEAIENEFNERVKKDTEIVFEELEKNLLNSSYESIRTMLLYTVKTTDISAIKLSNKEFLFSKETLLRNSNYAQNSEWEIGDVATDAKNGTITPLENNMYKLSSAKKINAQEPVVFKFFLYKNEMLINAAAKIYFEYEFSKENLNQDLLQNSKTSTAFLREKKSILLQDKPFAEIEYIIDQSAFNEKTAILQKTYKIYYIFTILFLGFVFGAIYLIFIKKMLLDAIKYFKETMADTLNNNFVFDEKKKSLNEDIDEAFRLVGNITKKYIIVLNELNINKNILERKVFTDDLTGLPNQKVFEIDLKNMFIVGSDGFIGTIKLESLGEFTKKFGSALANHYIEEFANIVQNKFYELDLQEASLYRFFGSEFAIILKNEKEEKVLEFCRVFEEELQEMGMRYEVENKSAYFGFIPFDKYGTVESILHLLSDVYTIARNSGNYYYMVSPSEVLDKFSVIEQNVREIIENNSFEIEYGFETTSIANNETLMREAIPVLYDKNREKFAIGVFISAAEKIKLAVSFDKKVIESVVEHIKTDDFKYGIVVNLSLHSLKDNEFITWLHSLFLFNKNISNKIIFSMTSYNASIDVEAFKNFVHEIHRFGAKVILKRFSINDFAVEKLGELHLDYLRINKDYTSGIFNDRDKKHFLRTIINLGQSNDIFIIGDSIRDERDIEACVSMGLDAISNY